MKHRSVIFFCISYQARILFCKEELIGRQPTIALRIFHRTALQFQQLFYHGIFTGLSCSEPRGVSVSLGVFSKMFEAGITVAGASTCFWIDFCKIAEHGLNGGIQAVQVESIETGFVFSARKLVIVLAKPSDEIENIGIAPHPGRKPFEIAESFTRFTIARISTNETIDAIGIRPIRFDGHSRELLFCNQPLRNLRAFLVELMSAMRRFTNENNSGVADTSEQRIIIARSPIDWMCIFADVFDKT